MQSAYRVRTWQRTEGIARHRGTFGQVYSLSYFIEFEQGSRLELMEKLEVDSKLHDDIQNYLGITHFAFSTGDRVKVDQLTEQLRADGYKIVGEPRVTGDGYYESIVLDPEGNKVEITE